MAAVFPLDTTKPWIFNGVTYEYDTSEDRWYVVSTVATDQVVDSISDNKSQIDVLDTIIDQEIDNRTALLNAAAAKNNQQDAAILELDARVDAIGATAGILEFKGSYRYVLEKSQSACDAALVVALEQGVEQYTALRAHSDCVAAIGDPLEQGTFTSIGTLDQSSAEELVIANTDIDGISYDWENLLETGDYIEIVEESQQDTVLYQVIADPIRSGTEERIRVKHIKETGAGDGNFNLQEVSEIRVIKQSLGLDPVEADKRYQQRPYSVIFSDTTPTTGQAEDGVLRNGELWYDTTDLELFVWNNNAWTSSAKPPSQDVLIQSIINDVDNLNTTIYNEAQRFNSLVSDLIIENNIYYSDGPPVGDITGTLRNGDLWIDSDDLAIKFYSQGQWINPDRQVGGDYLETTGGEMTGKLLLKRPRTNSAGNNLVIHGRIGGTDGQVLLKDYQRQNSSTSDDYILYYGECTSEHMLLNRKHGDARYVRPTGDVTLDTKFTVAHNGDQKFQITANNVDSFKLARFQQGLVIKAPNQSISGDNSFAAYPDYTYYSGRIQNDNDLVNKKYVDDHVSNADEFVYKAGNNLDSEDFEDPYYDGKFSGSSNMITNDNAFWYFSDVDQNGKMLNLMEHASSDDQRIPIQIGTYEGTYLTDPNVNREGFKVVYSGYVTQVFRMTKGPINNKVFTPGWELYLELGNGTSGIAADTIKVGGTYQIKFGGVI